MAATLPSELLAELGIDARGGEEDIRPAKTLFVFDAPFARIAVPICLDYFSTDLRSVWVDAAVNLFFVPAMSPELTEFEHCARDLGTAARATTFVCNSAWLLAKLGHDDDDPRHALAYLPARGGLHRSGPVDFAHLRVFSIRELLQ